MITVELKCLKILLVEDSEGVAELVKGQLQQIGITDLHWAASYKEAIELFDKFSFDIALVDIILQENKRRGDDFVRYLRRQQLNTPVIYLTGFFGEKIYEEVKDTKPHAFMSKRSSLLELKQALELCLMKEVEQAENSYSADDITSIFVKVGSLYKAIKLEEIFYFSTKEKFTYAHTKDRDYLSSVTIKNWEQKLVKKGFTRIHRGYLININRITKLNLKEGEITINDKTVPIGYKYRKQFLRRVMFMK